MLIRYSNENKLNEAFDFNDIFDEEAEDNEIFNDVSHYVNFTHYYDNFYKTGKTTLITAIKWHANWFLSKLYLRNEYQNNSWHRDEGIIWIWGSKNTKIFLQQNNNKLIPADFKQYWDDNSAVKKCLFEFFDNFIMKHYTTSYDKILHNCVDINKSKAYTSPDGGIVVLQPEYTSAGKELIGGSTQENLNQLYIMFTGAVDYNKKGNKKQLVQKKVIPYTFDWLCRKNCGKTLDNMLNHGFSIIPDKNGYPQLVTVITNNNFYGNLPSTFYKGNKHADIWTHNKIYSQTKEQRNPVVLNRKDSLDGLMEFGVFYPWDVKSVYKDYAFQVYDRQMQDKANYDCDFIMKKYTQENQGVIVYRLSEKAKRIFDELKEKATNLSSISVNKIGEFFESYDKV